MLIELSNVEAYVEVEDILYQALRDGDLNLKEIISICEDDANTNEILDELDNEAIKQYCVDNELFTQYDIALIQTILLDWNDEQKQKLLWWLIGLDDISTKKEIKKIIEVEIVLPRVKNMINIEEKEDEKL